MLNSWDGHNLTIFPPLTAQKRSQKGSTEFPEMPKMTHGKEFIHLLHFLTPSRKADFHGRDGTGIGDTEAEGTHSKRDSAEYLFFRSKTVGGFRPNLI